MIGAKEYRTTLDTKDATTSHGAGEEGEGWDDARRVPLNLSGYCEGNKRPVVWIGIAYTEVGGAYSQPALLDFKSSAKNKQWCGTLDQAPSVWESAGSSPSKEIPSIALVVQVRKAHREGYTSYKLQPAIRCVDVRYRCRVVRKRIDM